METSLPEGFLPGAVLRRVTMAGLLGRHALEGDAELALPYSVTIEAEDVGDQVIPQFEVLTITQSRTSTIT